jgi:hypothetical protein
MSKTNRFLLLALIVLGAAAFFVWKRGDLKSSIAGNDYNFAIKDTSNIGKIMLANRNGGKIILERKGVSNWLLNGKYKARQSGVNNLLEVIWGTQLKYRLPRQTIPNVVQGIATTGVKVELYDLNNKLLKAYYVGGVTAGEDGTYLMMENSNEPYCVFEPRRGNIRVSYFTKEEEWRDRAVFCGSGADYKRVWVAYLQQPNKSFDLMKTGSTYEVKPFAQAVPTTKGKYRIGSAETYLDGLPRLVAESFQNDNKYKDSLVLVMPFCMIGTELQNGQKDTVRLLPILSRDQYGRPITDEKGKNLIERYYAISSRGDMYSVQDRLTSPILRGYEFFFSN